MRRPLLLGFVILHLVAVILFKRGFLLSRLSLDNVSQSTTPTLQTHKRAIILIIDALRFDFLSPHPPPHPNLNPYYHNVLTLPAELTKQYPRNSFLFNAYADPPTTTLQRIKAITTGSLPTFVDMGSNFGAVEIMEDSFIKQAGLKNKSISFMGDDTWLSVFPNSFTQAYPYDSFNVEDLHTVDNGVLNHLIPLLSPSPSSSSSTSTSPQQKPDIIIGHFLGVDHVGHRLGPSHPSMYTKLKQMDTSLRQIVDLLQTNQDDWKDTILVVLGDHGMDSSGDHGGDGILETSSGMWIYSPGKDLFDPEFEFEFGGGGGERRKKGVFGGLKRYKRFPGERQEARTVQQIDLVPTLSLLLGLEIPFNNIGNVIPELFWRSSSSSSLEKGSDSDSDSDSDSGSGSKLGKGGLMLTEAMKINSKQINEYLNTYRSSSSGNELNGAWESLENTWNRILEFSSSSSSSSPSSSSSSSSSTNTNSNVKLNTEEEEEKQLITMMNYNIQALNACRSIWAQFNPLLMGMGLCVMVVGLFCQVLVYVYVHRSVEKENRGMEGGKEDEDELMKVMYKLTFIGSVFGFLVGLVGIGKVVGIEVVDLIMFGVVMGGCVGCVGFLLPRLINDNTNTNTNVKTDARGIGKWFNVNLGLGLGLGPIILLLHLLSFFSNSFTFWEEKIVLWLGVSSVVPIIGKAFGAPSISSPSSSTGKSTTTTTSTKKSWFNLNIFNKRLSLSLRDKILLNTFIYLICIRCINLVTVCREEQGGYCHVTFYSTPSSSSSSSTSTSTSGSGSISPTWSIPLSFLISPIILPLFTSYMLKKTKNDNGIAGVLVWGIGAVGLGGSWLVWVLEYLEGFDGFDGDESTGGGEGIEKVVKAIEEVVRLRSLRSWIGRGVFVWVLIGFLIIWVVPFCLDIKVSSPPSSSSSTPSSSTSTATATTTTTTTTASTRTSQASKQVTILGYANALGSPMLLFTLLSTVLVCLCTPLPGQVVLGLSYIAGVCWIEVVDCVKDVEELENMVMRSISSSSPTLSSTTTTASASATTASSSPSPTPTSTFTSTPNFNLIIPLILLAFLTFFGTGHQSVISSIQWKSGFILTETVTYPWSVITLLLNSFGMFGILGGCWCGLVGCWMGLSLPGSSSSISSSSSNSSLGSTTSSSTAVNTKSSKSTSTSTSTSSTIVTTTLQLQIYFLTLLLGTSISAAILRRHLMVWKVFAPRWMLAVVGLGMVDFGLIFVVWGLGLNLGERLGNVPVPIIGNGIVGRVNEKVGWVLSKVGVGRVDGKEREEGERRKLE